MTVRTPMGIELMPDLGKSSGLSQTPVGAAFQAPDENEQGVLKFQCFLPEAVFAADRVIRSREVATESTAVVALTQDGAEITQEFQYSVRYEAIRELTFEAAGGAPLEPDSLQFTLIPTAGAAAATPDADSAREIPLNYLATASEIPAPGTDSSRQIRVSIPQPRIGDFSVRVRSAASSQGAATTPAARRAVPLIQPVDGRIAGQQVVVRSPRGLSVDLDRALRDEHSWRPVAGESAAATSSSAEWNFLATERELELPLVISTVALDLPAPTIVERVWLQTWLAEETRQDRAAFRFRTTGASVAVELPPGVPSEEVEVRLDGQNAASVVRDAGRLVVELASTSSANRPGPPAVTSAGADEGETNTHTLELRYRRENRGGPITRWQLTPPQLIGTSALSEVYWHIVLPGDRHIIQAPAQLTPASQLQWLGSFWGRKPLMSQSDLEQWAAASGQIAPTTAHNEYLFSGLAPVASIEIVLAPRWLIVLLASAAVLGVTLVWIYTPVVRRSWLVVAAGCLIGVLAVIYPTPAVLLGQASVLGVVVATAAVLLARLVARPSRRTMPIPSSSSKLRAAPLRADSFVVHQSSAAASTTPLVAMPVPDSER